MNRAFFAENFLCARNVEIVSPPMPEVSESGTVFGTGQCGHPRTARASVKIHTEPRTPSAQHTDRRRQDIVHIGIVFEEPAKTVLYYYCYTQIGPRTPQNVERGSGQNAVAQRPEPDDGDAATVR
jgi:hypothetical protein